MKQTTMALGKLWDQIESEQISFSLELIILNTDCVKTMFVSLYFFVRSQTSLDHLVLSSEARRYLTLTPYTTHKCYVHWIGSHF
jgi:hypothetical protein